MIDIEDVANADFVNQLYRNFLGREPDANGFSYWSSALSNGQQNAASVTRDFLSSAELQSLYAPIVRLYLAAFNRIPDAGGFEYWIRDYRNGASLSDIAEGMAASDEFKTLYGQSSGEQFIKDLYRNTFSRQPDVPGESFWNAVLDIGVPRSAVIASFATSQEMLRTRSEEVDYILLHRAVFGEFPTREVVDAALPVTNWAALIEKLYESQQYDGVDVPGLDRYEQPAPGPEPEPEPEPDPGPPPDSTAPTILAFTVSSPSTLSVTSSEPGTAGLYNGSTLIDSQTTLANANTPYTLNVSAQPSPTNALLKVADNAGNTTIGTTEIFIGTNVNDNLIGTSVTANFIFGFDGHDTLVGGDGNDVLSGGAGNDLLTGGLGFNTFYVDGSSDAITDLKSGDTLNVSAYAFVSVQLMDLTTVSVNNSGVITIDGTSNADSINGSSGQDIVYGFSGADTISGGHGNDQLEGGEGNDNIAGNNGDDYLNGDSGDDYLQGGKGSDDIYGGIGNDTLRGGSTGADTLTGGLDNDTFDFTDSDASIDTISDWGVGTDFLNGSLAEGGQLNVTIDNASTTAFTAAVIAATYGVVSVTGGTGNDTITGGQNNDTLNGGDGSDIITGGGGNDSINGGLGNDSINGGAGDDTITGGGGADTINAGSGNNRIDNAGNTGGPFENIIHDSTASSVVINVTGSNGVVITASQPGASAIAPTDRLSTITADASTAAVSLTAIGLIEYGAILTGGSNNDTIIGGDGADFLTGNDGADTINGGVGNDTIRGGAGADVLTGGAGVDVFVYNTIAELFAGGALVDSITGGANTDTIRIDQATAFTIAVTDSFARAGTVETLAVGAANAEAISITLNADAFAAGVRTVTLAADTNAAGVNDVNASAAVAGQNLTLIGSAGNDIIDGGNGNDTITGGAGENYISGYGGANVVTSAGIGLDYIAHNIAGATVDIEVTGANEVVIEAHETGATATIVNGINGNVRANISGASVQLQGGDGNDTITGGGGNDTVTGGAGADVLTGGLDADKFIFAAAADTKGAGYAGTDTTWADVDAITDFVATGAVDGIHLGLDAAAWGTGVTFTGATTATVTAVTVAGGAVADIDAIFAQVQAASAGAASTSAVAQIYDVTLTTAFGGASRLLIVNDATAAINNADAVVNITGVTGGLSSTDFVFA